MGVGATNTSSCVRFGRHLVGMHGFIGILAFYCTLVNFLPLARASTFVLGNTPFLYCLVSVVMFSSLIISPLFIVSKNYCIVKL